MEPRISIITLGVKDLDASCRFYKEGLGFPTNRAENQNIVFFRTNGTCLALYPLDKLAEDAKQESTDAKTSSFKGFTLAHNVRTKEEVDQVLKLAKSAGATIVKEAEKVFWGGYSGYFSDPDGYLWEVAFGAFDFHEDGSLKID